MVILLRICCFVLFCVVVLNTLNRSHMRILWGKSDGVLSCIKVREQSASHARTGPGFDTRSGHILSFLLLHKGQLSVIGESMCTQYW